MVYKKNKKRSNRRRNKRKVFRPQRLLPTGFPKTTAVKLRYAQQVLINPGAGTVGSYVFRTNSAFDPDYTGVGHQPMGYDQWTVFYNHYVVVGAKIKATIALQSVTAANGMCIAGVAVDDDAVFSTNLETLMEQPLTRNKKAFNSISAGRPLTITKTFSLKKFFNLTNVMDNISTHGANVSLNPTEQAYFVIFIGNPDVLEDPPSFSVMVELEYICIFSEPKGLAQS